MSSENPVDEKLSSETPQAGGETTNNERRQSGNYRRRGSRSWRSSRPRGESSAEKPNPIVEAVSPSTAENSPAQPANRQDHNRRQDNRRRGNRQDNRQRSQTTDDSQGNPNRLRASTTDPSRTNNQDRQNFHRKQGETRPEWKKDYPGSDMPIEERQPDLDLAPVVKRESIRGGNPKTFHKQSTSAEPAPDERGKQDNRSRNLKPNVQGQVARRQRNERIQGARKPQTDRRSSQNQGRRSPNARQNDRTQGTRPGPSIPITTDRGIKLRSQRGGASRSWWARRWIDAIERLVDPTRLLRGRSYARSGQVLSIQETRSGIEAQVQGSRVAPYKVSIHVTHLSNEQWDQVVDSLSEQALFTAQLLGGEMPDNIEEAFDAVGVSLFPIRSGDLHTSCSCPDWANPCKHVAAAHYILGDRFDDDPFLLFRMRGRTQEQILDQLHQKRAGGIVDDFESEAELPAAPHLETMMDRYWVSAEDLDSFPLTITPPSVDMPMFKRLGEPGFLPRESLTSILKPVYDSFTRYALRAAYTEDEPLETNPTDENGG